MAGNIDTGFEELEAAREVLIADMKTAMLTRLADTLDGTSVGHGYIYDALTTEQRFLYDEENRDFASLWDYSEGAAVAAQRYWQSFFVNPGLAEIVRETRFDRSPRYVITSLGAMLVREGIPLSQETYERLEQAVEIEELRESIAEQQARLADLEARHEPLPEY